MDFLDRHDELDLFETRWARGSAELLVVWGRRRVGKTELLSRFLSGRRGLLFEATAGTTADQLGDLTRVLAETTLRTTLSRDGVLREEARLLLFQELAEPRLHFSVLRALAGGDTRVSQ